MGLVGQLQLQSPECKYLFISFIKHTNTLMDQNLFVVYGFSYFIYDFNHIVFDIHYTLCINRKRTALLSLTLVVNFYYVKLKQKVLDFFKYLNMFSSLE